MVTELITGIVCTRAECSHHIRKVHDLPMKRSRCSKHGTKCGLVSFEHPSRRHILSYNTDINDIMNVHRTQKRTIPIQLIDSECSESKKSEYYITQKPLTGLGKPSNHTRQTHTLYTEYECCRLYPTMYAQHMYIYVI